VTRELSGVFVRSFVRRFNKHATFLIFLMMLSLQPKKVARQPSSMPGKYRQHDIATWKQSCYDAMNDDFITLHPNRTIIDLRLQLQPTT
jgi:hypothetical protein